MDRESVYFRRDADSRFRRGLSIIRRDHFLREIDFPRIVSDLMSGWKGDGCVLIYVEF